MSGILFFIFASCEPLSQFVIPIDKHTVPQNGRVQIRRKRFFNGRWTVPLERDCVGIVLYSVLKSVRWGLSDGSALDRPPHDAILYWDNYLSVNGPLRSMLLHMMDTQIYSLFINKIWFETSSFLLISNLLRIINVGVSIMDNSVRWVTNLDTQPWQIIEVLVF